MGGGHETAFTCTVGPAGGGVLELKPVLTATAIVPVPVLATDGTDVAVGSGVGWGVGSGVALGSKVAVGPAFGWEAGVPASGAETGAAIGEEVQPIRARMSAPLVRLSARPEISEGNDRPAGEPNRTR